MRAGGFIGSHMVKRLKREGYWVRGVDLKFPEFSPTEADDFAIGDLRDQHFCASHSGYPFSKRFFQFAADMGGLVLFSRGKMMPTSCITRRSSI